MKGDFSRIRFSKKKNYRKVLYQQGRVSTDADQNEQVNIQVDHETSYLRDIIGKTGVPIEQKESSFKITPFITAEGVSYTIGKGRIYVDGILVENYSDLEARLQPYFPLLSIQDLPSDIIAKEPGLYLVYLDVWDRHITYLEDPDIQESALGGPDTTTRSQTVWQVKLHKLEEGDNINVNEAGENRWAPWESLDNNVFDLRIGTNTDGSFLEVFALSDLEGNKGKRMSIRQVSLNSVRWEDEWDVAPEGFHELEIEVATNSKGFLEMFGIDDDQLEVKRSVRKENSRWGSWKDGPLLNGFNLPAKAIAVGKNNDGSLMLFAINLEDNKIYYSKQINTTLEWEDWKPIFNLEVINLAVITTPNDNCIEVYAMDNSGRILYTRQERPDATTWKDWKRINQHTNPSEPRRFSTVTVGINRNKQPIIFATVSENDRNVWYTIRNELDFPEGNGWKVVGHNSPGVPISSITVQNNVKKDRLELFSIFADSPQIRSGIIGNISENEDGSWNSNWKTIAGFKAKMMVYSATDNLSRLNIFAIDESS